MKYILLMLFLFASPHAQATIEVLNGIHYGSSEDCVTIFEKYCPNGYNSPNTCNVCTTGEWGTS